MTSPPRPAAAPARRPLAAVAALTALFCLRLAAGLASSFWSADERMTYLTGLRAFARNAWPYFGADIVWTHSRLPGALQGLLIAGPIALWPAPEAPIVLLNLLTFAALGGLAWYVRRRLPRLPAWFVWGVLLTTPWTVHFSTHVVNTSYILPGAVVFFIGFFEATPALAAGVLPPAAAWAAMGFGVAWVAQIHMSWVLLPAYVMVAAVATARRGANALARAALAWVSGAALPGLALAPTILRAGTAATGGTERNLEFHARGLWTLVTSVAQFLSFPSFELNRFLGLNSAERLWLLVEHWWLLPAAFVLLIAGLLQPVGLLVAGFSRRPDRRDWRAVRLTAAATVALVYGSYFLSIRQPQAHAFYVTLPVAMLYAMSCWERHVDRAWFRTLAAALLAVNVYFIAGFVAAEIPERSLYRDRDLAAEAITRHEDRLLGQRRWPDERVSAVEPPEPVWPAAVATASATADLHVTDARWSTAVGGYVSLFDVRIANGGSGAAYLDIRYVARYYDANGATVRQSEGTLADVVQPGETKRWDHLVDGRADARAVRATFEIAGAEKALPLR